MRAAQGARALVTPPLLGFCSDLDPPSSFIRTANASATGGPLRGFMRWAEAAGGAAARRASKASKALLTKQGSERGATKS